MEIEITPMSPDSDGAELAKLFAESNTNSSLLEENDALIKENMKLRQALSQVATNLRNGSVVSPEASIEFMTVDLPNEVKLVIDQLRKRHPTKEEALAQYNWLKENSTRNK
jgi:regulator of replication initiation timing